MASVHKHIRSGTASKRPTTAIAEGQIALATNIASPGLFFKDSTGATIVKIGPVHVGATAPNATPAGSAGNSIGEVWLDTSLTPVGVKIYDGSAFVNATPIGSTTVQGLLELATDAETQAGADTARAITSASLQSKLSDSTSTTSNITIASSTAVKAAYDLANAALPKTGGTVTGNLEIGTAGSLTFEGATADGFETTIAVVDPTADRTITLPNTTGTVVTTGDTGTVTSTMLLDGTIVDADINAAAAIAYSKLATLTSANIIVGSSANVATSTAVTGDVTIGSTGVTAIAAGVIVNADVNARAAIAGTKIAPDFGAQNIATTGSSTAATFNPTGTTAPVTGVYSPGANRLGITTNSVERVEFGASEVVFNDDAADYDFRIEGDTNTNLFFADASAEAVGIRTATPVSELNVSVGNGGNITISNTNDAHSAGLAFGDTTSNSSGRISYDHSTNALAVATNGTQRITIDSSGRLLVGTATDSGPIALVEVAVGAQNAAQFGRYTSNSTPAYVLLTKSRSATKGSHTIVQNNDGMGAFSFLGSDGTQFVESVRITAEVDGTPGANDMPGRLVFSTTADGGSSPSERLRITSAGLVGIGASAPTNQLTVKAANDDGIALTRPSNQTIQHLLISTTETGGDQYKTKFNTFNTDFVLSTYAGGGTGGNIRFRTGTAVDPTDKVVITSGGLVGIGTTSPLAIFDVKPSSNRHILFSSSASYADNAIIATTDAGGETALGIGGTPIQFFTGASERARIDTNGRLLVGTGTDLTGALLQVNGAMNSNKYQQNVTAGSTDTIFTMAASQCYHIYCTEGTNQTHSVAIASCAEGSSTAVLTSLYQSSANTVLSASGLNIQVYNGAGSTRTIKTTILRMA